MSLERPHFLQKQCSVTIGLSFMCMLQACDGVDVAAVGTGACVIFRHHVHSKALHQTATSASSNCQPGTEKNNALPFKSTGMDALYLNVTSGQFEV